MDASCQSHNSSFAMYMNIKMSTDHMPSPLKAVKFDALVLVLYKPGRC